MEGNFDEISGRKLTLQLEQPAIDGNRLQFCARALAAFGSNGGSD